MVIYLMLMVVLQLPVDSISNQSGPYSNLNYELTNLGLNASFDPSSGKIYLFNGQDRTLVSISEESRVDTLGTIPDSFEALHKMEVTHSGEAIYFWETSVGRVHRYDIATGVMRREDTSHSHRTMFGHTAFLSEDNYIYAMGGYGYWEMRNLLIRYEPEFGQWTEVPSSNREIVLRSWQGLIYKIGQTFYYFVDNDENESSKNTHAYKFEMDSRTWQKETNLEDVFKNFSIRGRILKPTFPQNPTYMVDKKNRQLGFLSSNISTGHLNLVSVDESILYQLNLAALGVYDVRAAFFSDRIDQWIILGHEYPMRERKRLKAFLFEFNEDHPFITAFEPESALLQTEAVVITAGGAFAVGILGLFLFYLLKVKNSNDNGELTEESSSYKKPVSVYIGNNEDIEVRIRGNRMKISEDNALKNLWLVIAEMVQEDEASILVSNIDQRIYPNQSHPSYNSRNRRKLVKIINTACGFDLISEERSNIDKRYKVLTIQIDKIDLKVS